ncbi:iron-hydroxamate ABC transporter substrate-binding protein [Vibrio tubiashii]|nr:iron-hydroxamate ABC transporter substrate-binding protein [Vibrio tubiashii]
MGLRAATLMAAVVSTSAFSESTLTTKIGADLWFPKTKVNEVNRESDTNASFSFALEHQLNYVPDARVRYSTVDADYMAFDKLDLTLYYQIVEHDLMRFDAGMTFSDLSNTKYINADTQQKKYFDEQIWAWFGYGEIAVPNTNLDIIGEINFGDNNGIKSTDLIAALQYRLPLGSSVLALRGGYRVIDLESDSVFKVDENSQLGKPFIFANGFFAGAELSF